MKKHPHVDIEVDHHFDSTGATTIVKVIDAPHGEGNRFLYGLPLYCFGLGIETGRRYRLTIEELPTSKPTPKKNPYWRKAMWLSKEQREERF